MTHYGIKSKDGNWLLDDSGMIFWTTCRAVAKAQLDTATEHWGLVDLCIASFTETDSTKDEST